jgi:hypothetical protein
MMSTPAGIRRERQSPWDRTWFPVLATGFLGLIIVSAMAGIFVILKAIP